MYVSEMICEADGLLICKQQRHSYIGQNTLEHKAGGIERPPS